MVACFEPQSGLISRASSRHCPDPHLIILSWAKMLQLHLSLTFVQRQCTHIVHYKRIINSQAKKSENGCHRYNRTRVSLGDICNCYDICNCLTLYPVWLGLNLGSGCSTRGSQTLRDTPDCNPVGFFWLSDSSLCVPGGWSPVLGSEWCIYGWPDIYA